MKCGSSVWIDLCGCLHFEAVPSGTIDTARTGHGREAGGEMIILISYL